MNNFTEKTWTILMFNNVISKLVDTYKKYPPRKMQSETFGGPMTINKFRTIEKLKAEFKKMGYEPKK